MGKGDKKITKTILCIKCKGINNPGKFCPACANTGKLTLIKISKKSHTGLLRKERFGKDVCAN